MMPAFIRWFDEIGMEDVPLVGGKNASLGEMRRELKAKGVNVPNGFCVTVDGYKHFLESGEVLGIRFLAQKGQILEAIKQMLSDLDIDNLENLASRGSKIRRLIQSIDFPEDLEQEIMEAYSRLCDEYGEDTDVAVRSSATSEDLPGASFAGQQETFLNIRGEQLVLDACRRCFGSIFTNRAMAYRGHQGFDQVSVAMSVGVQKMVRSDEACSGVMFTVDTESGFPDVVFITGSYGLGENIVQGVVSPDEFYVHKPTMRKGYKSVIQKTLGSKEIKMVYWLDGESAIKNVPVSGVDSRRFILTDDEVIQLAKWAAIIEEHYSDKAGMYRPMDIEWAKDGMTNELFILQARPETVKALRNQLVLETYHLKEKGRVLIRGKSVGERIGRGRVNVIADVREIGRFGEGDVLVTQMTDPDWEPIMKRAGGIVTDRGGRTCHAAIISRELGVPCIVGTVNGTTVLSGVDDVTVSCAEGETGLVYEGLLDFEVSTLDLQQLERPKTQIMMNVGNPDMAFNLSFIPNDGVGLAREEFIISNFIRIHPLALLHFDRITDHKARETIEKATVGHANKQDFFIDKLAEGVAKIAAGFYPKDVIVRLSDFKSNEYANLIGGYEFEPVEDNPMIGFRGAARYYDETYREGFAMECLAMKKVRDEIGLTNVKIMIPFVRTVEEGQKVIEEMRIHGLEQGKNGLELYMMVEVPSNVVLIDEFSQIFDGFSIGSNDLTQLTLGLDRDSEHISHLFDERNSAVKRLVEMVIRAVKDRKKKIGICGQAPSDYPEFAQFLVRCGIDSMSLNPDTVIKTTFKILEAEKSIGR
jgi:pyruvate,water dikinase